MTEPGLNHRLRQRSRRAGVMIGVSMALTIAVCVAGFSVIYASLDGVLSDFVPSDQSIANDDEPVEGTQIAAQDPAPTQPPGEPAAPTAPPAAASQPTAPPTEPAQPTATPPQETFTPDYQSSSQYSLNLRSEPSSNGGDSTIVAVLPPASPLQYLNEEQPTDDPSDGDRWMRFITEDGDEGWVREIDVEPYEP